jgi:hypothetical protein
MGIKVKEGQGVYKKIGRAIDRATGKEQEGLGKAMVASGKEISPRAYSEWQGGKYSKDDYENSWGYEKKGNSVVVGNTAAHALVVEFGADSGSKR